MHHIFVSSGKSLETFSPLFHELNRNCTRTRWKAIRYKQSGHGFRFRYTDSWLGLDTYGEWEWVETSEREARRGESSRVESSVWCVWRWYRDKMKEPRSLYPTYMTVLLRTSKHNVMRCRYTARYIFQTWVFALYREGDIRIPLPGIVPLSPE